MQIRDFSGRNRALKRAALGIVLVILALALVRWGRGGQAAATGSYPREISRITFAAAGDVIPHQAVVQSANAHKQNQLADQKNSPDASAPLPDNHGGWDALFASVSDVFLKTDIGFVNLETPVAPTHSVGARAFQFDAPPLLLDSLKASGIKIVSFANNHVFDQGQGGFAETIDHLREHGLMFVGAGASAEAALKPVIIEKNGIKVGWMGMTRWLNGHHNPEKDDLPHVVFVPYTDAEGPGLSEAAVIEAIKAARSQCDLLLVSIHWGIEYAPAPQPRDVEFAHNMLEAGASAVIGHHPHVLQPIETYLTQDQRNTVIVYSLGNFLSNQSRTYVQGLMPDQNGDPRDSLIVKFAVVKRDYGPAGTRVELADVGILPVWTENNHLQLKSGQVKGAMIAPILMDREIPRLQARLDELEHLGQLTNEQKQEVVKLSSRLELLKHRREILLARTGDEYLVPPPKLP